MMSLATLRQLAIALMAAGAQAQRPVPDPWMQLRFLEGQWEGRATGQIGEGTLERQYEWVLNRRFMQVRHKSTYAPQPKNPRGEVHEDWGFISYDRHRKALVLRQFHVESFVTQYVADPKPGDSATVVFVSEALENIGQGWRAKETYQKISNDEFLEVFELAPPGKDFEVYTRNHFRRRTIK
jgi:hypothetical protein